MAAPTVVWKTGALERLSAPSSGGWEWRSMSPVRRPEPPPLAPPTGAGAARSTTRRSTVDTQGKSGRSLANLRCKSCPRGQLPHYIAHPDPAATARPTAGRQTLAAKGLVARSAIQPWVLWAAGQAVAKPVVALPRWASGGWGLPTACPPAHSGDDDGESFSQNKRKKMTVLRLKPCDRTVRG